MSEEDQCVLRNVVIIESMDLSLYVSGKYKHCFNIQQVTNILNQAVICRCIMCADGTMAPRLPKIHKINQAVDLVAKYHSDHRLIYFVCFRKVQ